MTHPDDELLSALIDGQAAGPDADHAETCETCQARLSELRAAAALVAAAPPGPPAGARDRAVAAALRAVVPETTTTAPEPPQRAVWWRNPGVLAAAAAVIILAVGAPLLATALDGGDGDGQVAMLGPAGGPIVAGDLGPLRDGEELAQQVRSALAADDAGRATGGGTAEGDDTGAATMESDAPESGAAALATGADPVDLAARCEPAIRADAADLGPLVYVATGSWEATPAVVMAFARDGEGISLYVLDAETCAILNWQRF